MAPIVSQANREARQLAARLQLGPRRRAVPIVVAWGPNATDLFPTPLVRDGVTFIAGPQLHDYLTALPEHASAVEIDTAYHAVDRYLVRVDEREVHDHGPVPRGALTGFHQLTVGLIAGFLVVVGVLAPVRHHPTGAWSVVAASLTLAATQALRRVVTSDTARTIATAVTTGAALAGTLAVAVMVT